MNAPANAIKPFPIDGKLIEPRISITGTIVARAPAATTKAADPARVPFIKLRATVSSASATPMATVPLPISVRLIPPSFPKALAKTIKAAETATKPTPIPIMFLGIKLTATVTSVKAPAIAVSPLTISSHCIFPKSLSADANIFMDVPRRTIANPIDPRPLDFSVK